MGSDQQASTVQVLPTAAAVVLIGSLLGAATLCALVLSSDDAAAMRFANGTLPALLGGVCLWCGYASVRNKPLALWTPLPWFFAAWAAYYGLGPLVYVYGTPETVAYMDTLYPLDGRALLRTNLLNAVGLSAVVSGFALAYRVRLGATSRAETAPAHSAWRVALLFLALGVPVKYLFELPYVLGLSSYVLPGSVQYLGTFSGLAILPLSVAAAEHRRGARLLLWGLIAAEVIVGFVMLAKLHIIKTVLLVFLGQYAVRPNLKRLIATGLLVAVAYVAVLSPFVNYTRILLGRASAQDLAELITAAGSYGVAGRETLADLLPGVQGWWSRLAYPNAQAFAMDQYDQGKPGWTFGMVGYVFVPRFLREDKPIMTPGVDFTYLIKGTDTSSTGLGFVGEAYWNGGWLLVVLVGGFVGLLFAVIGRFSLNAIRSRQWLYVPLIFQAIYLGLRPDDWFVPAYIGGVLQVVIVTLILHAGLAAMVRRRKDADAVARRVSDSRPTLSLHGGGDVS
ncbi:MAG TPA: hypothetical protein VNJ47_07935 [Nevskiales bacterium]|nr:hypothetical protein [Nevskiales bacterium]